MNTYLATFSTERALRRIRRIKELLAQGPKLARELAELCHMDHSMVSRYLRHLMDGDNRCVRIESWPVINGVSTPRYALGSEPDCERRTQSNKERWSKVKDNPNKYAASLESRRDSHRRRTSDKPKQRDRRVYDPPLEQQIVTLLEQVPGYTMEKMALKLDANPRSIKTAITKLKASGEVRRALQGAGKKWQWEVPSNPLPAPIVKVKHGWAAALGV